VISKRLERHTKAKRRAPAYSRALRRIKEVLQRVVHAMVSSGPISKGSEAID